VISGSSKFLLINQVSNNSVSLLGLVEQIIGALMIAAGMFLFRDPKHKRTNRRVYRFFVVFGAIVGYWIWSSLLGEFQGSQGMWAGIVLGGVYGYTGAKVAEYYIIVLGPTVGIVLFYDYMKYYKDVDLLELIKELPAIPNISNAALSGIALASTTFLTFFFRMHLRQIIPIFIAGIFSGGLIGNGVSIISSSSLPGSRGQIEFEISAVIAFLSISYQMYRKISAADDGLEKKREEIRSSRIKKAGDIVILRCPFCKNEDQHIVAARKQTARGVELVVNCRWLNEFDEVCDYHHTVIEAAA